MARNIEIKARVQDRDALEARVQTLADTGPIQIFQDDTFFNCANGRLKLRDFGNGSGELIFYQRPNQDGPKESFYILSATQAPDSLRDILRLAHGMAGRIIKRRTLYLLGQTRIHLDRVEELGDFMELEVVLDAAQSSDDGTGIAHELMQALGIHTEDLLATAYVDLLRAKAPRQ